MAIDPATMAAMVGAGGSAGSGIISAFSAADANRTNAALNREQMAFNSQEAKIQRDWQERMSNSAYQRQTADMKAAGINPMVAFNSGGAAVPSGSTASSGSLKSKDPIPSPIAGVLSSALETVRTMADAAKAREATNLMEAEKKESSGRTANLGLLGKLIQANTTSALAGIRGKQADSTLKGQMADIQSDYPRFWGWFNTIMSKVAPFSSAISAIK